jgi:hypothetical protein
MLAKMRSDHDPCELLKVTGVVVEVLHLSETERDLLLLIAIPANGDLPVHADLLKDIDVAVNYLPGPCSIPHR